MCETWGADGKPKRNNFRHDAQIVMEAHKARKFWFGLEQEYTLLDLDGWPYGWPKGGFPGPQGSYYCGVGAGKAFRRDIVEAQYRACLYAGINISGTNAEAMPAQWEFQVGPCAGIDTGDQLWIARFILCRIAEEAGVKIDFSSKPVSGDWNSAGIHSNVSTAETRAEGGLRYIEAGMEKLALRQKEHMVVYGEETSFA